MRAIKSLLIVATLLVALITTSCSVGCHNKYGKFKHSYHQVEPTSNDAKQNI